jgi:Holliday junction resolvasome RuvABC endonuclease subunit
MGPGMKALGVDQATVSGWTIGSTKTELRDWISGRFAAPKRPYPGERFLVVYERMCQLIEDHQPDVVACEAVYDPVRQLVADVQAGKDSALGRYNPTTLAFLHTLQGVVLMAAAKYGVPAEVYPSNSWRATLKLPRKPDGADDKWIKQATAAWVRRLGGKAVGPDECDSFGICFHALHGRAAVARIPSLFDLAARS